MKQTTIEDFFVDMSDLLTTYSGGDWDWDSEARDGVLEFSGHLDTHNGSNFYQYDLDFDEMREDDGNHFESQYGEVCIGHQAHRKAPALILRAKSKGC